jgi:DNA-binding transcriptional MerR regulator
MRVSELSRVSGVALPTIKFYLREGLLPSGEATGVNQARYGENHVQRLRLIRAMLEVGGLSIASAREVLEAVDSPELPLGVVFGAAQRAVSTADLYSRPADGMGVARIEALIAARGWRVSDTNPGRTGAANVLNTFIALGRPELADMLDDYADAAVIVARADLASVAGQPDVDAMAETVVAGTILGDAIFAALRRIAQEHVTTELFPPAVSSGDPSGHHSSTRSTP